MSNFNFCWIFHWIKFISEDWLNTFGTTSNWMKEMIPILKD
jgi:hypothetical protein